MRQLAERCDMRLSNLQYYYKTRDEVLKAMVSKYFEDCLSEISKLMEKLSDAPIRKRATGVIQLGLKHGEGVSDMCRIFRELWAISTRNKVVEQSMMVYYTKLSALMADCILGESKDQISRAQVRSILLPYLEGYSITAPSLPLRRNQIAELLTDFVMGVVDEGA